MNTHTFRAMGSRILIAMDADEITTKEAVSEAANWFEEWEQTFSRFRIDSELSEVNQRAGEKLRVSSNFWHVLELALAIEQKTEGLVTPTKLTALEEAGYAVSFEGISENIGSVLAHAFTSDETLESLQMNVGDHTIRMPIGMRLDLGGIVKGWAAQQAMIRLREAGPVLVDAGGDIAISGPLHDGMPWAVGVDDPFQAGQSLGLMMLPGSGIATSGKDYHRWLKGNQWQHHIIDPRTDQPAESDVFTATVIAEDVMEAEAWAKVALILGSRAGTERLNRLNNLAYLLVLEDGSIIENEQFTQYRWNEKWQTIQNSLLV
jgi:Membrane-associated lipoprotein involved in thiamine biosynthesis